ncbi:MCE family protein [Pedobacter sp. HMF7647]|uniref:MCE family protein n=1 Tax=Hufsiella arboris TaxID=2695275 RepID=A0A7K1YEH8_9SPHI|nr:MlaD family protein [Hufsiella arboris]MXV52438.1 MCE family protein [Hufsiella arboris]
MKISNETKVGVLTILAIVLLIIGYSFLKGNDVFSSEDVYYAKYERVDGLAVSKPVLVNGFQIGRVAALTLQPNGEVLAQFKINPRYEIPVNTIARLESTDLLGGKAIIFDLGTSMKYATDGDTLNSNIQKNFLEQVQPVQKKAELMVARLDSILTSINGTISPAFQKNFNRSFASIANTLETLEGTTKRVDGLVGGQSAHIEGILSNLESISANFKNNNAKITSIMNNIDKVTDEVAKANFQQTIENANKAIADFQAQVEKINQGQGSLGKLLNDEELYKNLNSSAANLNKLMIDLKAHPKRYVSFSVFGGKKD